jgi:hypothetical protein
VRKKGPREVRLVSSKDRGAYSASPAALGYLYQVRYALFEALRRLRHEDDFTISIETLDDVVFEKAGDAPELLQTKHHIKQPADLTDSSPDLWKSMRVWCEGIVKGGLPQGTLFFLVTTGQAASGSAAHYLRPDSRDTENAMRRLNSTAESSTSLTNPRLTWHTAL